MTSETILVLEDNPSLLHSIRDILEIQGYTVYLAMNGREGLARLRGLAMPPDLIISDIMMPEMDGYQFLQEVRRVPAWTHIPFIFLSAKGERSDIRTGTMLGADHYLTKPYDPHDLLIVVAAKLKRHREIVDAQSNQIGDVKKRILTILHHEFRTPLTYMVAYADMLNSDIGALSVDEMKDYLRGVNSGADRLRRLVENFIMLVEVETGEAVSAFNARKRETTDLLPIIKQSISLCQSFAEERGLSIRLDVAAGFPAVVVDPEYLRGALVRLIENAIKFTPKHGQPIMVKAIPSKEGAVVSVIDQGRGIPEKELTAIFQTFYQVDRHIHEDQGAGAGLPIVQRVVMLHGGRIEVQSTPGKGSTFSIHLPAVVAVGG